MEQNIACIKATFSWLVYKNSDASFFIAQYTDAQTGRKFIAKGDELPLQKGLLVELFGEWVTNPKDGKKQLRVNYFSVMPQITRDGVIAYLQSLKCGIGKTKAARIYDRYGEETWDMLSNNPSAIAGLQGIGSDMANTVAAAVKKSQATRDTILLFARAGVTISGNQAKTIVKEVGPEELGKNPYLACMDGGVTFEKADAVAYMLGYPANAQERLRAYIGKALSDVAMRGHVCMPAGELSNLMVQYLGCSKQECKIAVNQAWKDGKIKTTNGMVYLPKNYDEETTIADEIQRLTSEKKEPICDLDVLLDEYCSHNAITLAEQQRMAVCQVFDSYVSIITGGPGTGKTTTIKAVLDIYEAVYGDEARPILLAPTGRAARRMSSATGHEAQTIHSAVGFRGDGVVAENTPLEATLIIVDESSMMDQHIASILLKKCPAGCTIVFVGDPDQLPSVGCGNVLLDMIASGTISVTKLSVIFRQAEENPIIANAHRINVGNYNLQYTPTFRFIPSNSDEQLLHNAIAFYLQCLRYYSMDDVILLDPQRNNTSVSVDVINRELQSRLNPHKEGAAEMSNGKETFRIGDKVMQMRNTEVAKNGDTGYIRDIQFKSSDDGDSQVEVIIEFNGDGIEHHLSREQMRYVTLAYCTTVHKSQGEEYKIVIFLCTKSHSGMLKRNLIYTAITRSRENVCILGELDAVRIAIQNDLAEVRNTNLTARLRKLST